MNKILIFLFLGLLLFTFEKCAPPTIPKSSYIIKYYYKTGDMTMMDYIFILSQNDSEAYAMACDTFLNKTKMFLDTVKSKDQSNSVPSFFRLERTPDNTFSLSKNIMDSIYLSVKNEKKYYDLDTSTIAKYLNVEVVEEKPPVVIVKSWVTHNSINDPEANITIRNNSKKKMDGIKVGIYCYNNFGDKITYGFNDYFSGISQDKLSSGRSDTYTWTLSLFDNTTKIKPFIKEVHFTDGAKWVYDSD